MQIKWADPNRWKHLVLRPGMMHTLISFIGCIGTLMQGSGFEELIKTTYGGIPNIINGKAWPKAVRALRMITLALFEELITANSSIEDIEPELEKAR